MSDLTKDFNDTIEWMRESMPKVAAVISSHDAYLRHMITMLRDEIEHLKNNSQHSNPTGISDLMRGGHSKAAATYLVQGIILPYAGISISDHQVIQMMMSSFGTGPTHLTIGRP